ncbi:MAG TPA: DNA polymerase III subunit delta [Devosia sp.]|nr:DNA polymerase III subunit delta [Devosia sp.]
MTALKGRDIDRFVARPDIEEGIVLVYGPDTGLVRETGERLLKHYSTEGGMGLVTLDGAEIDADPGRLIVEARTSSLFGDKRVVRVRGAGRSIASLPALLEDPAGAIVVIEAGNLAPRDSLRAQVEASKTARALPCYADSEETILRLITETFNKEGIATEPDVAATLRDSLGNDREVTRRELEKLVLFAADSKRLTRDDVLTLCADNAVSAIDEVSDAIGTGHPEALEIALARALANAVDNQRLLGAVTQHFLTLRRWRAGVDAGKSPREVLDSGWPKPHFSRRTALEQQIRLWNDSAIAAAAARLLEATADSRKNYVLAETIMRRTLLSLARQAAGH